MNIAIIPGEQLDRFTELDPLSFIDRVSFPDRICLGATMKNDGAGTDEPVGLMILQLRIDFICVEWIFVSEPYRMKGIGGSLMEYAFFVARNMGFDKLRMYLNEIPGRTLFCPYENDFLNEYYFLPVMELPGEWDTQVKSLLDHPAIGKSAEKNRRTLALSELDEDQKKSLEEYVKNAGASKFLYSPDFVAQLADRRISRVLLGDKGIEGAILLQHNGENVYVTGLSCNNRADELSLCHGALMAAKEKYGSSQSVHVLDCDNMYTGTLHGLFGEHPVKNCIYESSVSDYFEAMDLFVPDDRIENSSCVFHKESDE